MKKLDLYIINNFLSKFFVILISFLLIFLTVDIIDKLVKHCNKNSIQLATGESAQVDQAYTLKVVETAKKRTDDAASKM